MKKENAIWLWMNNNPIKAIVILSVFIRLLIAALYQHITLYPDTMDYVYLADRLTNFNLSGYEGERSPGYPFLLSIAGLSYLVTVIVQSLLGVCTLILFYKTLLVTGVKEWLSLSVSLAMACYLPIIFFELAILSESLTLFLISVIFYLFFDVNKSRGRIFGLAVLCGYLILVKPFYVFLPVLLFVFLMAKKLPLKIGHIKYAISLLIIPFSVFFGWSYINKVNTGYFVSSTFYGFNVAQNCVSFAEKTTPEYKEIGDIYARHRDNRISDKEEAMVIWEAYPELEEKTGLSYFPDLSKRLYDYSMATIKANPGAYSKQVFISWCNFWKTALYWESDSFAVPHANSIVQYICYVERIVLQLIKILFVLLIPYNLVLFFKKREISPQLVISVLVFTASVLQALATYGTNSRFSFPFELLIVVSVLLNAVQHFRTTQVFSHH